jgi:hypothetical protein
MSPLVEDNVKLRPPNTFRLTRRAKCEINEIPKLGEQDISAAHCILYKRE